MKPWKLDLVSEREFASIADWKVAKMIPLYSTS